MLLLFGGQLADKDARRIDQVGAKAAKVSKRSPALLPVGRQVMRLHVSEVQAVLGLDFLQGSALPAYLGGGRADQVRLCHRSGGPAHARARAAGASGEVQ